jgi:hypothetical protein
MEKHCVYANKDGNDSPRRMSQLRINFRALSKSAFAKRLRMQDDNYRQGELP